MEREKDVGRTSETRRKSGRQWTRTMRSDLEKKEINTRMRERETFFYSLCVETAASQGGNSQNFLHKFIIFFVTLRCFYRVVIYRK